jgi:peroxiredoxin
MNRSDTAGWIALILLFAGWQPAATAADAPIALSPAARELLVQKLYSPLARPADFEEAAAIAAQAGLPDQTIAEARLAFCIRTRTVNAGLIRTIDDLEALRAGLRWQKNDSRLFLDPDELEGTLFFARALVAEHSGDQAEYGRCLREAFWWNPSAGALFGDALRGHRRRAALAGLSVPPDETLRDSGGRPVMLKELSLGHKAVLLEFWASWCEPCMTRMGDLKARAASLEKENVVVAGVNVEQDASVAEAVRRAQKIAFPWLVDAAGEPLCQLLHVPEIPYAVLLGPDGIVRFSGHPGDAGLRQALQALGVEWKD